MGKGGGGMSTTRRRENINEPINESCVEYDLYFPIRKGHDHGHIAVVG